MTTLQFFRNRYFAIYVIAITIFILYYYYCRNDQLFRFDFAKVIFSKGIEFGAGTQTEQRNNNFHYNWLRMHRSRINWREILKPCLDQMSWGSLKSGWGKANRSSARTSYVSYMDIQPSGQFSRIFIHTRTASGQDKTIGGDFWRVFLIGPSNVAATIFDHQNGTYEAIALLMEPGNYSVRAYLDYTLCDGLRNPPEDWFRIGNAQGKLQPHGILGFLDHYIYESLRAAENLTLEVSLRTFKHEKINNISKTRCTNSCRSLWEGHGRWKNNIWLPYFSENKQGKKNTSRSLTKRNGTLWIYGDSLGFRFHQSLSGKPLCIKIFEYCIRTYNWVYPVPEENEALGKKLTDNFDFRPNIILDSIKNVLRNTRMKNPQSLLVLNLGLHYPPTINFTTFQNLIDDVIVTLSDREKRLGSNARVIWKTTTSIRKENATPPRNRTAKRFFTEQRVRLFDAYAMSAMCKAGFEILDVFPLTASYMPGTMDIVHYRNEVFNQAEIELEKFVKEGSEYKNTIVCIT